MRRLLGFLCFIVALGVITPGCAGLSTEQGQADLDKFNADVATLAADMAEFDKLVTPALAATPDVVAFVTHVNSADYASVLLLDLPKLMADGSAVKATAGPVIEKLRIDIQNIRDDLKRIHADARSKPKNE